MKVADVAGGHADQRVVEAGQQLVAADLVGEVGGGAARHLLAVDRRGQVDLDEVAALGRPLDGLQRGEPLPQSVELLVDLARRRPATSSTVTSMLARSGSVISGPDVDLGGELQRLAVGELGDLDLGPTERLHLVLAHRGEELLRDRVLHRLVEDRAAADPLVDHRGRHLALAETGDRHLCADLPVRLA